MNRTLELEVLAPGLLTTVQDVMGRPGYARYGIATSGALEAFSAQAANLLVGNPTLAAVLEITLAGPTLRFGGTTACALAGADLGATLNGSPLEPNTSWLADAGSVLQWGRRRAGARAYLAVAGGLLLPAVLGSRATDLRAGFGGLDGRALRAGDRLAVPSLGDLEARRGRRFALPPQLLDRETPVRVLPGPHVGRFVSGALEALFAEAWRISPQSDRMGYRLLGTELRHVERADVATLGLPLGAVQVSGDGQPIVLLADHQPTGGYTVLACVIRADLPLLAQRLPGDPVRFTPATMAEARAALAEQREALRSLSQVNAS